MSTKLPMRDGRQELEKIQGLHKAKILSYLRSMDPIQFEQLMGAIFESQGYKVKTTAISGDEGVDLELRKGDKSAVVQCKRYRHSVGPSIIRELYGTICHNNAAEGYLVTTGSITKGVRTWSEGKPIHLIDGDKVVEWIVDIKQRRSMFQKNGEENTMTVLLKHDGRTERLLRRYFDGGRHHWVRWLIFLLIVVVVALAALELRQSNIHVNMALFARSYMPSWFPMQEVDNAIEFITPYVLETWVWLQEVAKTIPIPEAVFQQLGIDESNQALFVWGIVFPIATFIVYLLIWALLAVTAAILRWVTPWNNEGIFTETFLTDGTVDQLLKKRIETLKQYAYRKLNLAPNEMVMEEPLIIQAPILWYRQGVTFNDLHWRIGNDGKPRFGVYRVLILYLTDCHLCIYSCYYNLIKGVIAHESLDQHLYREVAGVSLAEYDDDIVLKLRSGRRVKLRRQFRIDFTNGEKLTMTIDGSRLSQEVGVSGSPQLSGAEKAYRVLNQVLTEQARGEGKR